jgi:hypothetical protein
MSSPCAKEKGRRPPPIKTIEKQEEICYTKHRKPEGEKMK